MSKIRTRIEKTSMQRAAVEEKLEFTVDRLQYTADSVLGFMKLLVDPGTLYSRASDAVRRDLLSAYFNRLIVYVNDEGIPDRSGTPRCERADSRDPRPTRSRASEHHV